MLKGTIGYEFITGTEVSIQNFLKSHKKWKYKGRSVIELKKISRLTTYLIVFFLNKNAVIKKTVLPLKTLNNADLRWQ